MGRVEISSYAKINLTLDVLKKRTDGFHQVKMLMQTVSLCDYLRLEQIRQGIQVRTNLRFLPTDGRNIAHKAAKLFLEAVGKQEGIKIQIRKNIPVAAGLAGGSSNAAAVLLGMNSLYNNPFSKKELLKMGETLGSDVPYCLMGGTMLAEGRGEHLTRVAQMPYTVFVVAKPAVHVSTAWVYQNLKADKLREHPDTNGCIEAIRKRDIPGVAVRMFNVLETVTVPEYPVIRQLKLQMLEYGALGSAMSGSGPTVIGLFDDFQKAKRAEKGLRKSAKDVYVVHTVNTPGRAKHE